MKKRMLSGLLALCLALTLTPTGAFASGGELYIDGTEEVSVYNGSMFYGTYTLTVTAETEGGSITGLTATADTDSTNRRFLAQALEGLRAQLTGKSVSGLDMSTIDGVSGATYSADGIKAALVKALAAPYTVTYLGENGETLYSAHVTSGTKTPAFAVPEKSGFRGVWEPAVESTVTASAAYRAKYTELPSVDTYELEVTPLVIFNIATREKTGLGYPGQDGVTTINQILTGKTLYNLFPAYTFYKNGEAVTMTSTLIRNNYRFNFEFEDNSVIENTKTPRTQTTAYFRPTGEPGVTVGTMSILDKTSLEPIAQSSFKVMILTEAVTPAGDGVYMDGTRAVETFGYVPTVTVTVENGLIAGLEAEADTNDVNKSFLSAALSSLSGRLTGKAAHASEIDLLDGVTGATYSGEALKAAVKAALSAGNEVTFIDSDNALIARYMITSGTATPKLDPPLREGFTSAWDRALAPAVTGSARYKAVYTEIPTVYTLTAAPAVTYDLEGGAASGLAGAAHTGPDGRVRLPLLGLELNGAPVALDASLHRVTYDVRNKYLASGDGFELMLTGDVGESLVSAALYDVRSGELLAAAELKLTVTGSAPAPDGETTDEASPVAGFGYTPRVTVTVKDGLIEDIRAEANTGDMNRGFFDRALEGLRRELIGRSARPQTAELTDAVSGATRSSEAILEAARRVLSDDASTVIYKDESGAELLRARLTNGSPTPALAAPEKYGHHAAWSPEPTEYVTADATYSPAYTKYEYRLTVPALVSYNTRTREHSGLVKDPEYLTNYLTGGVLVYLYVGELTRDGAPEAFSGGRHRIVFDVDNELIAEGGNTQTRNYLILNTDAGETPVKMSVYDRKTDELLASADFKLKVTRPPQVIFRVENGQWNGGGTDPVRLIYRGAEGGAFVLTGGDIPAAGAAPAEGYVPGSWDSDPSGAVIDRDTVTFTYSYKAPADLTALRAAIAEAKAIDRAKYTDETVSALESRLAEAEAIAETDSQQEADRAEQALRAAIGALREKPADPGPVTPDPVQPDPAPSGGGGSSGPAIKPGTGGDKPAAPVTPDPAAPAETYEDVKRGDWFFDEVEYVTALGLMDGTGNNRFEPQLTFTRAMAVTVLYRLEGQPKASGLSSFLDVAEGLWYTEAIAWAEEKGIVNGYDPETFGPLHTVTREQLATILYRYAGFKGYDTGRRADLSAYSDAAHIGDWAQEAMEWAAAEGLMTGRGAGTLAPKATATRAEAAAILARFHKNVK